MPSQAKPNVNTVWASGGLAVPVADAKQALGFVAEIPEYPDFNGLIQQISAFLKHVNQEGVPNWDANTQYYTNGFCKVGPALFIAVANSLNVPPPAAGGANASWRDFLASFTTAPQFDNDTSPATTAFVQQALGSFRNTTQGLATGITLTPADVGRAFQLAGATPVTVTLPRADSTPRGSTFAFMNNGGGAVTLTVPVGTINIGTSGGPSAVVGFGDSLVLVNLDGASWFAVGGSAAARFSSDFAAVTNANGWQRMPSNLIIQWGQGGIAAPSGTLTFSLAFPTECLSFIPNKISTDGRRASSSTPSNTGVTLYGWTAAGAAANVDSFSWIAIGK